MLMTNARSALFVSFPESSDELLHWWHVREGALFASGCDSDPLLAADIKPDDDEWDDIPCVALLRSASTTMRWHLSDNEANERQALTAAMMQARSDSLSSDELHIAGQVNDDGTVLTACMDQDILSQGLLALQERGLDPDIITPASCFFYPDEGVIWSVDLRFDQFLRGEKFAGPNEPALRSAFLEGGEVEKLDQSMAGQVLAGSIENPVPNLRSGLFAKKARVTLHPDQRRMLAWALMALVVMSLLIPVVHLLRLHLATQDAIENTIAMTEPVAGNAANPEEAERLLNEKLVRSNLGNAVFSVPAAALFSAVQQTPGVSITRLSYQNGGVVAAELSAVRNEDINPALLAVQAAGFKITATPQIRRNGHGQG